MGDDIRLGRFLPVGRARLLIVAVEPLLDVVVLLLLLSSSSPPLLLSSSPPHDSTRQYRRRRRPQARAVYRTTNAENEAHNNGKARG